MLIIGITGPAGSGKSTFGGMLAAAINAMGYTVALDCFALGIKDAARAEGWDGITKSEKWRAWMQNYGQAARDENPDIWINQLEARHTPSCTGPNVLIITDVRHENERDWCRDSDADDMGVVVWMTSRAADLGALSEHPSEAATAPEDADGVGDIVICNSGALGQLQDLAAQVAVDLMAEQL